MYAHQIRLLLAFVVSLLLSISAVCGQQPSVAERFEKREYQIPMRDGVKLFTAVYSPRDASDEKRYPILMMRTCYSVGPYGEDQYRGSLGPSRELERDGYIFVYQDVRGCYMSEGQFVNMTPHRAGKQPGETDESSDTYDSVEWLITNVAHHNGRVGQWGISYPGFYAAAGMIDAHPALVAVSPQAPIADWWYDDFHHHGAFFLPHGFNFLSAFGQARPRPTTFSPNRFEYPTPDGYQFYLEMGPLKNANRDHLRGRIAFWDEIVAHPNYDEFWQQRNLLPHLRNVAPAVLVVGGWFDAEDLYGPLQIYREIEAHNPGIENSLVMGPWDHGGWSRRDGDRLGNIDFESKTSDFYRRWIEYPFFHQHLKGNGAPGLPEAYVFETGSNRWRMCERWPPENARQSTLYLHPRGSLRAAVPAGASTGDRGFDEFLSDPAKPVPFTEKIATGMTREYMIDDQRFASRRPDVLVYATEPFTEDLVVAGPLTMNLHVSTTAGDADWIVKLIDVFPDDAENSRFMEDGKTLAGYQMMVRSEVVRGRFRNDPSKPEPFAPGEVTLVQVPLQDVLHRFLAGHRLMIQIQSTWFPLVDRNPQKYVDNIFLANEEDFIPATHRVYRTEDSPSSLEFTIEP